jgi:hypothetical protein
MAVTTLALQPGSEGQDLWITNVTSFNEHFCVDDGSRRTSNVAGSQSCVNIRSHEAVRFSMGWPRKQKVSDGILLDMGRTHVAVISGLLVLSVLSIAVSKHFANNLPEAIISLPISSGLKTQPARSVDSQQDLACSQLTERFLKDPFMRAVTQKQETSLGSIISSSAHSHFKGGAQDCFAEIITVHRCRTMCASRTSRSIYDVSKGSKDGLLVSCIETSWDEMSGRIVTDDPIEGCWELKNGPKPIYHQRFEQLEEQYLGW